ncbi:MAG: hypothetical protein ACI4QR_05985, partial [Eubacteriales bacterium]
MKMLAIKPRICIKKCAPPSGGDEKEEKLRTRGASRTARRLICRFDGKLSEGVKKCVEFLAGGVGYGLIEIMWRGRTHWSMVLVGGVCFVSVCSINKAMRRHRLILRAAACALFITCTEFLSGL